MKVPRVHPKLHLMGYRWAVRGNGQVILRDGPVTAVTISRYYGCGPKYCDPAFVVQSVQLGSVEVPSFGEAVRTAEREAFRRAGLNVALDSSPE